MQQNETISISIELGDTVKPFITVGNNGKRYLNLQVQARREPDKFGNDLSVSVRKSKGELERDGTKVYVGNGKTFIYNQQGATTTGAQQNAPSDKIPSSVQGLNDDDLPF